MLMKTRVFGRFRLTHAQIDAARPRTDGKIRKLSDGGNLHVAVLPSGTKSWRLKYRFEGKPRTATLGEFPDTGVALAREKADKARRNLAAGIDPVEAKRAERRAVTGTTFETYGREWHAQMVTGEKWDERHAHNVIASLERDLFPTLGKRRPAEITSRDILDVVQAVAGRARETADRIHQRARAILDYAALSDNAPLRANPAAVRLGGLLPAKKRGHFEPVPLKAMPPLMARLESGRDARADLVTRLALRFLALTVGRSSEVRRATWDEIDREDDLWRVPVGHMKTRAAHFVPLTKEALAVLDEARAISTGGELIFGSVMRPGKPFSDVTLSKALHALTRVGVPHGVRTTFSSWAHDKYGDQASRTIEMCLSHVDKDKVRGVYDRSLRLDKRREILTEWALVIRAR